MELNLILITILNIILLIWLFVLSFGFGYLIEKKCPTIMSAEEPKIDEGIHDSIVRDELAYFNYEPSEKGGKSNFKFEKLKYP